MEVSVKNFGTIGSADVHIGGLTVITGENDTGKSTVGKILFSLVKAVARYEEDLEEDKEARVTSEAERLYFSMRRTVNIASHGDIRDMFHPRKFYGQFKLDKNKAFNDRLVAITELMQEKDFDAEALSLYVSSLHKIMAIMDEPDDRASVIKRAIRKSFFSEFKEEIINKGDSSSLSAVIKITDGASDLIDISWEKEGFRAFHFIDDLGYADATYVDSPAIMQYHHLVGMARTLFDDDSSRLTVPLHVKDLAAKLSDSRYGFSILAGLMTEPNEAISISSSIGNIFGGVISYDDDAADFVLERNGYKVSSGNIASGIKSLGILDMLVRGGNVKNNTLLILDEPEVNLHPKWQVDYCRVICGLVKSGVDIIVTTHSPYIVEALKHFCDHDEVDNKFYLATKQSSTASRFDDITGDISVAIDRLAAPLLRLNVDSVDDFLSDIPRDELS